MSCIVSTAFMSLIPCRSEKEYRFITIIMSKASMALQTVFRSKWTNKSDYLFFSFFFSFFLFGFYGPSRLFHSFSAELVVRWGKNRRSLRKKHLTIHKQNLACLTWPELGLNPQLWDDKRFRLLKMSDLNHSDTEATWKWIWMARYNETQYCLQHNSVVFSVCSFGFRFLYPCQEYFSHIHVHTVMILSFQTDRPGQTVQTQIRLS